jgi:predicted nucleic acid-binding protein
VSVAAYFADTCFWIALSSPRDRDHPLALAWSRHLVQTRAALLTTELVLWEWLNALSEPATRGLAAEGYRRCHRDPQLEVVAPDADLLDAAARLYEARHDKHWSLTDCCSFVIMEQRGLTHALTTDHHFQQAGFQVVLLEDPPES